MKEIIYLDVDTMNSMLAQLGEGLVTDFSLENQAQSSETAGQTSGTQKQSGIGGSAQADTGAAPGGRLRLSGKLGSVRTEETDSSSTFLEGQRDILNKAFHDYALDVLLEKLVENELLVDDQNMREGSLYFGESTFNFYDLDLIGTALDPKFFEEMSMISTDESVLTYEEAKKVKNTKGKGQKYREAQAVIKLY
ncbi:hypothetical protein CHH69_18170, partial [Terribacillus saccharophilus]|uniref:DUF6414 family protein n=1 Tax=Terribacillus saccharophilus TaxID=361277 RepID=UPI000BCAAC27